MPRKILITGGTGYIGGRLIEFTNNIYDIVNLGRNKNLACSNIFWNLKDKLDFLNLKDIDAVIHCASIVGNGYEDFSEYIDINVKSTLELLEYSRKNHVKKFILLSTGGVYGFSGKLLSEEDLCKPRDIYSLSKYFSEEVCKLYKDEIMITVLRLFFPYGEGQKGRLISNLFENIIKQKRVELNGKGLPVINPVHILDVINVLKIVIENDFEGTFNICGNEFLSIEELCRKIAMVANIEHLEFSYGESNVGKLMGSNKKICEALDYNIKINLKEGLRLFLLSLQQDELRRKTHIKNYIN